MGTWMIHFLFPELKSQHLGEVEASAPSPPVSTLVFSDLTNKDIGQGRVWCGQAGSLPQRPLLKWSLVTLKGCLA